jgi:zinc protease
VSKLTRKQCREFHKQAIVPNRAIMVVVGDFDTDELIKTIQNGTKNWKPTQNQIAKRPAPPVAGKPGEIIVTDPTASQTHVYIGHIGITRNNPDYYKLLVMDNVLGTGPGFTDRLSAQLRDRQGLAYTVTAQIAWYAANEPGVFLGYIGTFPDKYTWVREGFLKEIQKIRDEPARDAEVDSAKKYLLGKLPFNLTTSSSTGELLLATELFGLGFNYLEEYREQVSRVTVADVQAVARKYLDPKRITIVAVGPIDKDGKALEENRDR